MQKEKLRGYVVPTGLPPSPNPDLPPFAPPRHPFVARLRKDVTSRKHTAALQR